MCSTAASYIRSSSRTIPKDRAKNTITTNTPDDVECHAVPPFARVAGAPCSCDRCDEPARHVLPCYQELYRFAYQKGVKSAACGVKEESRSKGIVAKALVTQGAGSSQGGHRPPIQQWPFADDTCSTTSAISLGARPAGHRIDLRPAPCCAECLLAWGSKRKVICWLVGLASPVWRGRLSHVTSLC